MRSTMFSRFVKIRVIRGRFFPLRVDLRENCSSGIPEECPRITQMTANEEHCLPAAYAAPRDALYDVLLIREDSRNSRAVLPCSCRFAGESFLRNALHETSHG